MSETSAGLQIMVRAQVAQDPSYGSDPGQTHGVPMVEPGGLRRGRGLSQGGLGQGGLGSKNQG